MDSQNQSSSSANVGPQIRSRITVVCAECKRLKLRCDRRAPCGSCTKRDTVVRCIYSPAAAEKVDLHSLNNRLIQAESILAMITSGQTPPVFQPAYPFSLPPAPTSSSHPSSSGAAGGSQQHHHHHHHYAAPPSSSQSTHESLLLSEQDVNTTWLDELNLYLSANVVTEKGKQRDRSVHLHHPHDRGSGVKLEPSPVNIDFQRDHHNNHLSFYNTNLIGYDEQGAMDFGGPLDSLSPNLFPRQQYYPTALPQPSDTTPLPLIPPLSIYYPAPTILLPESTSISRAASPPYPPFPTSPSTSSGAYHLPSPAAPLPLNVSRYPTPSTTGPQITPALLALLPGAEQCRVLLGKAREVFRVRPIPFTPPSFFTGASPSLPASLASLAFASNGGRSGRHRTEPKGGKETFEAPDGEADRADQNDEEREGAWRILERRCWAVLGIPFASSSAAQSAGRGRNGDKIREDKKKGKDKESRRSKEDKERQRAREIYFAGRGGLGQNADAPHHATAPPTREGSRQGRSAITSPTSAGPSGITSGPVRSDEPEANHEESLAFFALMCAVLAVGASANARDVASAPILYNTAPSAIGPESSESLHALSQQAMGVWDIHTSSSVSTAVTKEMAELERLDHLLACIVCVEYLLLTSGDSVREGDAGDATEARQEKGRGRVSTTVGRLVNAAHNMGLGRDPPRLRGSSTRASSKTKDTNEKEDSLGVGSVKPRRRGRENDEGADPRWQRDEEEWRRVLWWSVLYYNLFTASALGQPPSLPPYVYMARSLPSLDATSVPTTTGTKIQAHPQEVFQANAGGEIKGQNFGMSIGVDISEDGGMRLDDPYISDAFIARSSRSLSPNPQVVRGNSARSEREYLSARCRLTHLVQRILYALGYPGCCCGYTLDQAFALEGELRSWRASLPPVLKSLPAEIDPGGAAQNHTRDVEAVHASELALLANMLTMKLWSPFLRAGDEATPTSIMNSHAAQASLQAASGILEAAKTLVPVLPVREMAPSATMESTANAVPTSLAFLSLPKVVWDSVVVCARASMDTSSSDLNALLASDTIGAPSKEARLEAVRTGLDLLAKLAALEGDKAIGGLKESEKQVAEGLYKCFVLGIAAPVSHENSVAQAEGGNGDGEHGRKRKHDEVDFGYIGEAMYPTRNGTEPDASLSLGNGLFDGSGGDDVMTSFEFTGFNNSVQHLPRHQQPQHQPQTDNNPGQYLLDPNPVDQQQQPPERSANSRYEPVTLEHSHAMSSSHSTSVSPMPPPPIFSPQQQNEGQDKPSLAAVVFATAVSRRDEQDRERGRREKDKSKSALDKEKEKAKKPTSYPSVSIRVRVGKDGLPLVRPKPSQSNRGPSSSSPSVAGKAPGPLMTSTPRPLPSSAATADRVLAYQQQQKQKTGGGNSATRPAADMTADEYRSRSSSLSMGLGPIQIQPQHPTPPQEQTGLELSNYGLMDMDKQQEHEQPHTYHPAPHASEQTPSQHQRTSYDPPPQSTSFDPGPTPPTNHMIDQFSHNPDPSHGPFSHPPSTKVSPFSNHPSSSLTSPFHSGSSATSPFPHHSTANMSGSSSSFASMSMASGNPVMPTFGNSNTSHHAHPTPPVFGRPSGNSTANPSGSPTTYFHSPHSFAEGAFVDSPGSTQSLSGRHAQGIGMLEDANVDTSMHQSMMPQTGLYEKTTFDNPHQRTIATQSQPHPAIQQHQHSHPLSGYDGHHDLNDFHAERRQSLPAMSMGSPSTDGPLWPPPAASLAHEHQSNQIYPYWNT